MLPNMKKPCAKCPFRKDTIEGWLGKKRMEEILSEKNFVCHKTAYGEDKDRRQCAGHMLLKGSENEFVQLAKRLKMDLQLSGRELVFESEKDCINHHGRIGK